jgi:hypothetical protein
VYPLEDPDAAINIDGALGDGSQFHRTFGTRYTSKVPAVGDRPHEPRAADHAAVSSARSDRVPLVAEHGGDLQMAAERLHVGAQRRQIDVAATLQARDVAL